MIWENSRKQSLHRENSFLSFIEAVHEWYWKMPHVWCPLANERNCFLSNNSNTKRSSGTFIGRQGQYSERKNWISQWEHRLHWKEPIALSVTYTFDLRCFMNTGPGPWLTKVAMHKNHNFTYSTCNFNHLFVSFWHVCQLFHTSVWKWYGMKHHSCRLTYFIKK